MTALSLENVRFDMQAMENPEYQQGELSGCETREHSLENCRCGCACCPTAGIPLQIEHRHRHSRGGPDRLANLTLACEACNRKKDLPVAVFLKGKPHVLRRVPAHARCPLAAAAAVTRHWMSVNRLAQTGGPVELSSGDRTERYRTRLGLLKTHSLDAVCVGSLETVLGWDVPVLQIGCAGRRACQRTRLTAHGFARGSPMRARRVRGVQTGDIVRAIASGGKKAGVIIGRSAIRASGSFNAQTTGGALQGICWQYCQGWTTLMATAARYETMRAAFLPHA